MFIKEKFDRSIERISYFGRKKKHIKTLNKYIYDNTKRFFDRAKRKYIYSYMKTRLQRNFYYDNKNYYEDFDIWEKMDDYFLKHNLFNKKLTNENIKKIKELSYEINEKINSIIYDPFNFSRFDLVSNEDNEYLEYNLHNSKLQYSKYKKLLVDTSIDSFLCEWKNGQVQKDFDLQLWSKLIAENFYCIISNRLLYQINDFIEDYDIYHLSEFGYPNGTIYWIMKKSDSINLIL